MKLKKLMILVLLVLVCYNFTDGETYDRILVWVEDEIITENELSLMMLEQRYRNKGIQMTSQEESKLRDQNLQKLIDDTLLLSKANQQGIQVSNAQVEEEIEQFKKRNSLTSIGFEELLEAQNTSLTEYKKIQLDRIKRDKLINREIRAKIKITDESLVEIYNNNKETTYKITARHILRRVSPTGDAQKIKLAKDEILFIKDNILVKKEEFKKMALLYSQDPSVKQNFGILTDIDPKNMVSEFAKTILELPMLQLSEPVQTQFGFHLIEVLKREKSEKKALDEVKNQLYRKEFNRMFLEGIEKYLKLLRKSSKIVFNE